MTFLLQLFLETVKGVLLRDGEVAEPARLGLVIGIRDTRGHGTGTGGLLGISHGDDDKEEEDKKEVTGSGGVWWKGRLSHDREPHRARRTVRREQCSSYIHQAAVQKKAANICTNKTDAGRAIE